MDLKEVLNQAMLAITIDQPVPVEVAKKLVAEVCLYRSKANWLKKITEDVLSDVQTSYDKAINLINTTQGAFSQEDEIYLQAYVFCANKRIPTEKLSRDQLIVVPGGKNEAN
jgi:hypothetical protein